MSSKIDYRRIAELGANSILRAEISKEEIKQAQKYWEEQKKIAKEYLLALKIIEETNRRGYGIGDVVMLNNKEYKIVKFNNYNFVGVPKKKDGNWLGREENIFNYQNAIKIDPALSKLEGKVLFKENLEKANEILEKSNTKEFIENIEKSKK